MPSSQHTAVPRAVSRRDFLRITGAGALGALAVGRIMGAPGALFSLARAESGVFTPDVEINLEAKIDQVPILPGEATQVWRYQADLVQGPAGTVQPLVGSYLGPVFNLRAGQNVRINFTNNLAEESIVHWHGLHVPEAADGHPRLVIAPGESYVYEFQVMDRAGTYWYHPHPHGRTGPQAYNGLAGLILIADDDEAGRDLPTGAQDLPLAIQDRTFSSQNQLTYDASVNGFLGDQILVNGQSNTNFTVTNVPHRLRLLNGSNSRIYKLAWPDGAPLTVIGTDGGLLDAPVQRAYVTLAPAERVELLVDFSQWPVDSVRTLHSLAFSGVGSGATNLPHGSDFPVMSFQIADGGTATPTPESTATVTATVAPTATGGPSPTATPAPGSTPTATPASRAFLPLISGSAANVQAAPITRDAARVAVDRTIYLYMQQGQWTLNGRVFEMEAVAADEIVTLGTQEVWEFVNERPSGGGMGPGGGMPHPMHIHDLQFRVISRQAPTDATQRANWETVKDGYVDEGWKDTVLVMTGERVQVQLEFKDYTGLFLYHCHNLEHEDMGMMRNYEIVA